MTSLKRLFLALSVALMLAGTVSAQELVDSNGGRVLPALGELAVEGIRSLPTKTSDQQLWSLRSHWSFDDCPSKVPDLTGRGLNGTRSGVSCSTGGLGQFTSGTSKVTVASSSLLSFTDQMTLSLWIKPDETDGVFGVLRRHPYVFSMENGRFKFGVLLENGAYYTVDADVHEHQWNHVAAVLTPWTSNRQLRLYVNGQNKDNTTILTADDLEWGNHSLIMGDNGTWDSFEGQLDQVSLYGKALNDADLAILASSAKVMWRWAGNHGAGSTRRMLADVSGDGRADAVVFHDSSGAWKVAKARSTHTGFQTPSQWKSGFGTGSADQMLADVNGDSRADAVAYDGSTGQWKVALSTGSGFGSASSWITGHGIGSSKRLLGDVDNDGRADAIVFFNGSGNWYVALSNGSGFDSFSLWTSGHGIGSNRQLLGDVNFDGCDDAVVYFGASGAWYVAKAHKEVDNSCTGFDAFSLWISGHGVGSSNQFLADLDGNRRADALIYTGSTWYVSLSTGSSFGAFDLQVAGHGIGSSERLVGDVNGDGRDDLVVFHGDSSNWYTVISHAR